eukprot:IDg2933t1
MRACSASKDDIIVLHFASGQDRSNWLVEQSVCKMNQPHHMTRVISWPNVTICHGPACHEPACVNAPELKWKKMRTVQHDKACTVFVTEALKSLVSLWGGPTQKLCSLGPNLDGA